MAIGIAIEDTYIEPVNTAFPLNIGNDFGIEYEASFYV